MKKISKENFVITGRFLGIMVLVLVLMIIALPLGASQAKASGLPSYYPQDYDGEGQIYEFKKSIVIIDDRAMKLADGVRYYTLRSQWASPAQFPKGTQVGYKKNQAGEITGIWLMPKTDL